jgi:hypothetical protein
VVINLRPSGRFDITICTGHPGSATFTYDTDIADLPSAMKRAADEADRLGIPYIHVEGGESA